MEAKDTVMGNEKKSELWKQAQKDGSNPYNEFTPDELMTELVAYHQAEISFKAGRTWGIQCEKSYGHDDYKAGYKQALKDVRQGKWEGNNAKSK